MNRRTPRADTLTIGHVLLALIVLLIIGLAIAGPADAASVQGCTSHRRDLDRRACIIRVVFGTEGRTAVRVAWCESRLDPNARNGQFRGVFQMGSSERRRFGHGRTVLAQARAAKRYHDLSGWSPWECGPSWTRSS